MQPVPAKYFLLQLLGYCQGQTLHLATRNMYFLCFLDRAEVGPFFLSSTSFQYIIFWELELIYLWGRKEVIPCLPVNKLPLTVKTRRNSLTLVINGLFVLAELWLMDSHCSLQAGLIFSRWFVYPYSKEKSVLSLFEGWALSPLGLFACELVGVKSCHLLSSLLCWVLWVPLKASPPENWKKSLMWVLTPS